MSLKSETSELDEFKKIVTSYVRNIIHQLNSGQLFGPIHISYLSLTDSVEKIACFIKIYKKIGITAPLHSISWMKQ